MKDRARIDDVVIVEIIVARRRYQRIKALGISSHSRGSDRSQVDLDPRLPLFDKTDFPASMRRKGYGYAGVFGTGRVVVSLRNGQWAALHVSDLPFRH